MNYPVDYVTASRPRNYNFDFSTSSKPLLLDNSQRKRLQINIGPNLSVNKKPKFLSHQMNNLPLNTNRLTRKVNTNYASNSSIVNFKLLGGNTKPKPVSKPFLKNISSYIDYINNFSSENAESFVPTTLDSEVPDGTYLDDNISPTEFNRSPSISSSEDEKSRYRFMGEELSQNFVEWNWNEKRQPKEKLFLPLITLPQGQDFSVNDFN